MKILQVMGNRNPGTRQKNYAGIDESLNDKNSNSLTECKNVLINMRGSAAQISADRKKEVMYTERIRKVLRRYTFAQ